MRVLLVVLAATALAGCAPREEAACPGERPYVTIHYVEGLDPEPLRQELVGRGWRWEPTARDTVRLTPPPGLHQDTYAVLSPTPGTSGAGGTILSVEGSRGGVLTDRGAVDNAARDLSEVVNATYGSPQVDRRVAGLHFEPCP